MIEAWKAYAVPLSPWKESAARSSASCTCSRAVTRAGSAVPRTQVTASRGTAGEPSEAIENAAGPLAVHMAPGAEGEGAVNVDADGAVRRSTLMDPPPGSPDRPARRWSG